MSNMPAAAPPLPDHLGPRLQALGERIRAQRKQHRLSAATAAEAAGMSRVTLHRIERGEPSVTMGASIMSSVFSASGSFTPFADGVSPEALNVMRRKTTVTTRKSIMLVSERPAATDRPP